MKNKAMQTRLSAEVLEFIGSRKSLQLATLSADGSPYASYAPFAPGDDCLYVLLSDIAVHGANLALNPLASVLIIEDESSAGQLFARIRVNYSVAAELLEYSTPDWDAGLSTLTSRHGERPAALSAMSDFRLFRLTPEGGRYVKGFGRAFTLAGGSLAGEVLTHMTDGHTLRSVGTSG